VVGVDLVLLRNRKHFALNSRWVVELPESNFLVCVLVAKARGDDFLNLPAKNEVLLVNVHWFLIDHVVCSRPVTVVRRSLNIIRTDVDEAEDRIHRTSCWGERGFEVVERDGLTSLFETLEDGRDVISVRGITNSNQRKLDSAGLIFDDLLAWVLISRGLAVGQNHGPLVALRIENGAFNVIFPHVNTPLHCFLEVCGSRQSTSSIVR